jgi:hypothetical protein
MNEKIRELAEQADAYAHLTGEGMMYQKTRERYTEKFAELIIRECIKQVEPTQHHQVWAQSYLGGVDGLDLLSSKIKDIKKHFGVEL